MKTAKFVFLLLFALPLSAQQIVPVTVPASSVAVPASSLPISLNISGLPAGCTWSATGGPAVAIIVTCAVVPPISTVTGVTVSGPISIASGAAATFTATVQGANEPSQAVTWTATGGTISAAGVLTPTAAATTATATATSVQDPTHSGSATVSIAAVTPPGTPAIGATIAIMNPCPAPCHMWPTATAGGGVSGTAIDLTAGASGTIVGGPVTTSNGLVWWQVSIGSATGWLGLSSFTVSGAPVGGKSNTVSWKASPSTNLMGYNVYRGTSSGQYVSCNTSPINGTSFTDGSVFAGTKYFYVVTAVGNASYTTPESVHSNEASATD